VCEKEKESFDATVPDPANEPDEKSEFPKRHHEKLP